MSEQLQGGRAGRRYQFRVRARFGTAVNGYDGKTTTVYATTPGTSAAVAPGAPVSLSHTFIGDDVRLQWVEAHQDGPEILRWEVSIGSGRRAEWAPTGRTRPGWQYGPHSPGTTRT